MENTSRALGPSPMSELGARSSALLRPCPNAYNASHRVHRAPFRVCAALDSGKIAGDKAQDGPNPKEGSAAGGLTTLANQLLMNAASLLRSERKTAHCIPCQGSGIVECSACKGAGILAPEKVAKMNTLKHAVHKLKAKLSSDVQFDDDWVHLCGSFTRWVETVPMTPVDTEPGTFSVVVHLPPGYHQYKFIVDGEWRHDETQPFMPDPLGNVNNWLFVRKPEPSAPVGALHQQLQQQAAAASPPVPATLAASPPAHVDTEMAGAGPADGVMAPIAAAQVEEPAFTRRKIKEFLAHHSAYELIPESGKIVLLDVDLPLRQAFHALHEQGLASAPLYCSETAAVAGIVSASDFIATLQRLRSMVSTSSNPMSEAELDQHTIRGLREELAAEGRPPRDLVSVAPADSLAAVVRTLYDNHCSMAPVVRAAGDDGGEGPEVLHAASLAGVLACLMRHFRASLASLPLLAQPLNALPLGTWAPDSSVALAGGSGEDAADDVARRGRRIVPLRVVHQQTPLTEVLGLLLEAGVSCLPVVDAASGALVDVYARSDITMLAKSNAYNRLQFEDVTVGQALALTAEPGPPPQLAVTSAMPAPAWPSPSSSQTSMADGAAAGAAGRQRVHVCTAQDALRFVVERLALPGVRRVFVVHPESRRVEGIVSLSDVASFMLI